MAYDYGILRRSVDAIVERFGMAATLRRSTATGTFDPTLVNADSDIVVLFSEYTDSQRDGTLIQAGDRRALIKAGDIETVPAPGDQIVTDDATYAIVNVMSHSPAGVAVLYEVQARA
jgi:hypothetical protein